MISFINLAVLFAAKVADNALSTTKTILVQRSRWILVYTVEGNSGDACRQRQYAVGSSSIYGYGIPAY